MSKSMRTWECVCVWGGGGRVVGGIVVGVIGKIPELSSCVVDGRYRNPLIFLFHYCY